MTEILLFHHVQGLTDGVVALADRFRAAGHVVHTPDLFDGHVFDDIEDGFGYAKTQGLDTLRARGASLAEQIDPAVVHAGLSFGVPIAQSLAQHRPGARGALLLHSCMPLEGTWPAGVPVQIHGKGGDEFFEEDLPFAEAFVAAVPDAELLVYEGNDHLFTDSSLDAYDSAATDLLLERVLPWLDRAED